MSEGQGIASHAASAVAAAGGLAEAQVIVGFRGCLDARDDRAGRLEAG